MKNIDLMIMEGFFRDQVDPRRKQEKVDSGLVSKDNSKIANCPSEPINKTWNPDQYLERFCTPGDDRY
jgi:hypothetical protein